MIPEFAMRLICGLATSWMLAPRRDITSGFFRIQMLVTLGLGVLAIVTASQGRWETVGEGTRWSWLFWAAGQGIVIVSFLGSILWGLERRRGGTVCGAIVLILAMMGLTSPVLSTGATGVGLWRNISEVFSSAWLIGSVTAAMLLGHWYLTATGMSLSPLVRYTKLFGIAAAVRCVVLFWTHPGLVPSLSGAGSLVLLRWAGVAGAGLLSLLTLRILRYRNTQSATGVLYAATILAFMGEMAGALSPT